LLGLEQVNRQAMKILVQNLQKRNGLATELFEEHDPDLMLLQEINIHSETHSFPASNVSSMGYGTAIESKFDVTNIKYIQSPYAELGGIIYKKTTVASIRSIQFVSFHGYNGQPFKNKNKLVAHVEAVLAELSPGPALFAGDFNTWSKEHLDAVKAKLESAGFHFAYSWPYPGRDDPLDHAFLRGLELKSSENYACTSDHRGAILELDVEEAS
jgi:endonuclease/exonuclease/phosphatase family metal-dependent hydrolase